MNLNSYVPTWSSYSTGTGTGTNFSYNPSKNVWQFYGEMNNPLQRYENLIDKSPSDKIKRDDETQEEYEKRMNERDVKIAELCYEDPFFIRTEHIKTIDILHPYLDDEATEIRRFIKNKLEKYVTLANTGDPISMAKVEAYTDVLNELKGSVTKDICVDTSNLASKYDTPATRAFDAWVKKYGIQEEQAIAEHKIAVAEWQKEHEMNEDW